MEDLTVLEGEVEKYRDLLSRAESQETIDGELAKEIARFEISFEDKMNVNQDKITEIIKLEKYEAYKTQGDLDRNFSKFREYVGSVDSVENLDVNYSQKTPDDLELRFSNFIKQEELYMEYLELQGKRMDLDMEKGFKIHEIRYDLDGRYKQGIDYHRLMEKWEKQAQNVYETDPEGMYV